MKSSSIYSILRFTAVSFRAQLYDKEEKRCAGTWVQAGPWIVEIVRIVANVHEKQWIQRTNGVLTLCCLIRILSLGFERMLVQGRTFFEPKPTTTRKKGLTLRLKETFIVNQI